MTRWERLKSGQPTAFQFWYRQSPQPLEPLEGSVVTADDPAPQLYTGMAGVWLDTAGRLVELRVVPPELEGGAESAASPEPDWAPLFAEAGLDPSKFTPAEPRWVPHTYADRRAAWEGVFPLQTETPLRSPSTASASRSAGARSSAGDCWRISADEGQSGTV
jgi:hypothetical protein